MNSPPGPPQPPRLVLVDSNYQTARKPSRLLAYSLVGLAASSFAALGVLGAYFAPTAPESLLAPGFIFFIGFLFFVTFFSGLARFILGKELGEVSKERAAWKVRRGKRRFEAAWLFGLGGVSLVAFLLWIAGDGRSDLFTRGAMLVLIGGGTIGLAWTLIANFLFLIEPRPTW